MTQIQCQKGLQVVETVLEKLGDVVVCDREGAESAQKDEAVVRDVVELVPVQMNRLQLGQTLEHFPPQLREIVVL